MTNTRVALVDDHEMFRDGLRDVLAKDAFEVTCEAGDARGFLRLLDERATYDVAIIDLALPGVGGIDLTRELRRRGQAQPIVLLTMHCTIDMIVEGLFAGASGYIFKTQPGHQLCAALTTVLTGQRYLPPTIDAEDVQALLLQRTVRRANTPLGVLSPREHAVFDLLVRGHNNSGVARELCISIKTVETHRSHIFEKLQVHSAAELVRLAVRHNLFSSQVVNP